MLLLEYIGYGLSLILIMLSIVFFLRSIYVGLKYTKMLKHTNKSIKLGMRYSLLAVFAFGIGFWLFLSIESGFSWSLLVIIAAITLFAVLLIFLNAFISGFFSIKE